MLVYALSILALIGFAVSFMTSTNAPLSQTSAPILASAAKVAAQATSIAGEIAVCADTYPSGDNGTAYRQALPAGELGAELAGLACPGAPELAPGQPSPIFGTTVYNSVPSPVDGLSPWRYFNDSTSARIEIEASTSKGVQVLAKASEKLGSASVAGSKLTVVLKN